MEKIRLLIADEASKAREIVRYALENSFSYMEIDETDNFDEAKLKLETRRYDLVLCDWDARNVHGEQVLRWMRAHPALNAVPFIMLTAKDEKSFLDEAVQAGVTAYLVKPFSIARLVHRIMSIVSKLDRREFERFAAETPVTLRFSEHKLEGQLIDVSLGGVLGTFRRMEFLPQILEKVLIDLEPDNKSRISGIQGFVIRVQAAEKAVDSKYINIAIKFLNIPASTKKDFMDFFDTLILKI